MRRLKIVSSIVLATIFLATQIMVVGAAPARQETTPPGTVESITLEPGATTEETVVVVVLSDGEGGTQTVRLDLVYAQFLGLVDESGNPVDPITLVEPVEIDPDLVLPEVPEETEEEAQHPVGSAISNFFSDILGVDYDTVMEYHNDGVGFGVIVQALWMTNALNDTGDTEMTPEESAALFAAILDAKQNKDYSAITLPDGSTPQNWGQFRKAVMQDREKSKENLGAIMSGRADNGQEEDALVEDAQIHGNGNNPDKANGNKDKDKSNNGKNNDHPNNKDKNKNKGNNK